MIHIYTGDGKGKTTAAVGLTIRAIGNGLKVLFVQFIKDAPSGEIKILEKFPDFVTLYRCSTGFIYGKPETSQIDRVKKCLVELERKIKEGNYKVIVLDEFAVSLSLGLISREDGERLILASEEDMEIVITGRDAPDWLIERADLVTEMHCIKHYFNRGIRARKGIEY